MRSDKVEVGGIQLAGNGERVRNLAVGGIEIRPLKPRYRPRFSLLMKVHFWRFLQACILQLRLSHLFFGKVFLLCLSLKVPRFTTSLGLIESPNRMREGVQNHTQLDISNNEKACTSPGACVGRVEPFLMG
jgi:hypothetical protein